MFQKLKQQAQHDEHVWALAATVECIFQECIDVTKSVVLYMPEFTLHDEVHLIRVVDLMGMLLPESVLQRLQPLEVASLILAAALHDVGMAPSAGEIRALLSPNVDGPHQGERLRYHALRQLQPELLRRQSDLRARGDLHTAQEIEGFFLSEYIRQTHADRAKRYIHVRHKSDLVYRNFSYFQFVAEICYSHNQGVSYLERLPCDQLVGNGEYVNFRFVAVLLRLADILDFDSERTPAILYQQLGVRSTISVAEWKKHAAISGWDIRPDYVAFTAQCPDPVIEKSIRDFLDIIDQELRECLALLSHSHSVRVPEYQERYRLNLPFMVDRTGVGPAWGEDGPAYTYIDVGFVLDQQSIKTLLMGVNLYAQRFLFLRELVQNAVDACRHRRVIHASNPQLGDYTPEVVVRLRRDGVKFYVDVEDNGMGMDEEIVRKFFARVGVSYYKSAEFLEHPDVAASTFRPVSQFGIGVLSSFMVTDRLIVDTKRFSERADPLSIEIAGEGTLFWFQKGTRTQAGTRLSLPLTVELDEVLPRISGPQQPASEIDDYGLLIRLQHTMDEVAPHVEFPILLQVGPHVQNYEGYWRAMPDSMKQYPYLRTIEIDLTRDAPSGIDGHITVLLLEKDGQLVARFQLEGDCVKSGNFFNVIPVIGRSCTYLNYANGVIYRQITECKATNDGHHGYYTSHRSELHLTSQGHFSQQGFGIPFPIFASQSARYYQIVGQTLAIHFPFPIWFDINLSGRFVLPLTADRKNVLSSPTSEQICAEIEAIVLRLFLRNIGQDAFVVRSWIDERLLSLHADKGRIIKIMDAFFQEDSSR